MNIENTAALADELKTKYSSKDPFRIADDMGIVTEFRQLGTYDGCCKGFFICAYRIKHITLNSDLSPELQKIIMAHELGHAVLHEDSSKMASFHEISLFDDTEPKEYEANIFAAELLLDDEEVMDVLNEDSFFFQAAGKLMVPAELLDFKFRIMKRRGYKLDAPIIADGSFLKNISPET